MTTTLVGREAPAALEARYQAARDTPSDIHAHLPLLRELAGECAHVTEFGLRRGDGSTVALLAGQPDEFISWDINPAAVVSQAVADLLGCAGRTRFQPRVGNTLRVVIEPTDLLFIDTVHTAPQLKAELLRHGTSTRKYLAFHDTETYGVTGEDGSTPGLRAAIRWFQREHSFPRWRLLHDRRENNGLVVLAHV